MYQSRCRNCKCLHFYGDDSHTYPRHCYCQEAYNESEKCLGYLPKDNLEYLEWVLEYGDTNERHSR